MLKKTRQKVKYIKCFDVDFLHVILFSSLSLPVNFFSNVSFQEYKPHCWKQALSFNILRGFSELMENPEERKSQYCLRGDLFEIWLVVYAGDNAYAVHLVPIGHILICF